jgi:transposase
VTAWRSPRRRSPRLLPATLTDAGEEIRELETRIRGVDRQLALLAAQMPAVAVLHTVPGVGLVTATALVASVGDIRRFRSGRHFASYLGLPPREDSTALHRRLGAISTQGEGDLRRLLIHGARSFLWHAKACAHPHALQRWAVQTHERRGHNIAAVAVANTLARIVWPSGASRDPLRPRRPSRSDRPGRILSSQEDCTELDRTMAHRSDRRGAAPITRRAREVAEQRLAPRARMP